MISSDSKSHLRIVKNLTTLVPPFTSREIKRGIGTSTSQISLAISEGPVKQIDLNPKFKQIKIRDKYVEIEKYFPRGSSKVSVV